MGPSSVPAAAGKPGNAWTGPPGRGTAEPLHRCLGHDWHTRLQPYPRSAGPRPAGAGSAAWCRDAVCAWRTVRGYRRLYRAVAVNRGAADRDLASVAWPAAGHFVQVAGAMRSPLRHSSRLSVRECDLIVQVPDDRCACASRRPAAAVGGCTRCCCWRLHMWSSRLRSPCPTPHTCDAKMPGSCVCLYASHIMLPALLAGMAAYLAARRVGVSDNRMGGKEASAWPEGDDRRHVLKE